MQNPACRVFGRINMSARREQISVTLDPDLRIFAEQVAAREDRTLAGQIRHWVAEAARRAATDRAADRGRTK
jgi:hypothetical protein